MRGFQRQRGLLLERLIDACVSIGVELGDVRTHPDRADLAVGGAQRDDHHGARIQTFDARAFEVAEAVVVVDVADGGDRGGGKLSPGGELVGGESDSFEVDAAFLMPACHHFDSCARRVPRRAGQHGEEGLVGLFGGEEVHHHVEHVLRSAGVCQRTAGLVEDTRLFQGALDLFEQQVVVDHD